MSPSMASKNSSSSSVSMMSSPSCRGSDMFWWPPGVAVAGECTMTVDTLSPVTSTSSGGETILIGAGRCDGTK